MDGGRITSAVSPYFGLVGLAGGAGLIYTGAIANPIFYLIMMGGAYSTTQRVMGWDTRVLPPGYYSMGRGTQFRIFSSYLAVIVALLVAMQMNNQKRKTPRQLERGLDKVRPWEGSFQGNGDGVYDDYFDSGGSREIGRGNW